MLLESIYKLFLKFLLLFCIDFPPDTGSCISNNFLNTFLQLEALSVVVMLCRPSSPFFREHPSLIYTVLLYVNQGTLVSLQNDGHMTQSRYGDWSGVARDPVLANHRPLPLDTVIGLGSIHDPNKGKVSAIWEMDEH